MSHLGKPAALLATCALAALACVAAPRASAQEAALLPAEPAIEAEVTADADDGAHVDAGDDTYFEDGAYVEDGVSAGSDILSANTFTVILDARLVVADGGNAWVDGGFGKTRFDGTASGDFQLDVHPVEAALIWQPRFSDSFNGNFSAAYQHDHALGD